MMNNKINKFENTNRIGELNPIETLKRVGFTENMVLCDIGAGTGIFSFPATEITHSNVYALEISDEMIELLELRKEERGATNLHVKKVISDILPLDNEICDMVLMVTVLQEIENTGLLLPEINRILKKTGKLVIIEFHKKVTPMGPPIEHRLSIEKVEELCLLYNFRVADKFDLGDNFYCITFEN